MIILSYLFTGDITSKMVNNIRMNSYSDFLMKLFEVDFGSLCDTKWESQNIVITITLMINYNYNFIIITQLDATVALFYSKTIFILLIWRSLDYLLYIYNFLIPSFSYFSIGLTVDIYVMCGEWSHYVPFNSNFSKNA